MNDHYSDEYSAKCLAEITKLVNDRHDRLRRTGLNEFKQGGCLILGNAYARTPYLYLGINPGWPAEWNGVVTSDEPLVVGPCSSKPFNSPFINDQSDITSKQPG